MQYFELEVSLADLQPRIWRRFLLHESATFYDLHEAIQNAFGWENCHLWEFSTSRRGRSVAVAPNVFVADEAEAPPAEEVLLSEYFSGRTKKLSYMYDFGDSWEHHVVLKKRREIEESFGRRLLAGKECAPFEDCGGVPGWERIREFLTTGVDPWDSPEDLEWIEGGALPSWSLEDVQQDFERPLEALSESGSDKELLKAISEVGFAPVIEEIDPELLDVVGVGLMAITLHEGDRVWKGLSFEILDRLHARGWITNPTTKAKSVRLTEEGTLSAASGLALLAGMSKASQGLDADPDGFPGDGKVLELVIPAQPKVKRSKRNS